MTLSLLCLELILALAQSEPPGNGGWIGPSKGCGYRSTQDITSSSKYLDLGEVTKWH